MASRGYDYGGGPGAGGKLRRRAPSRAAAAAAASPYARPAPAAAAPAAAPQGGGWFSRIVAACASRLLPSLFLKPSLQLTAPAPSPPEPLEERPSLLEPSRDLLPEPRVLIDAPPSPLPPPLEDDLPEGEENGHLSEGEENGLVVSNNAFTENLKSTAKDEDVVRSSDDGGALDVEALLKQRIFTRSEFDYLAKLLWSRTIGSTSLKPEDANIENMHVPKKQIGSVHANLPIDFSIRSQNVADQVASPAEIAKAYMGSKSSQGSPLRLRLHDPSSLPIKSVEANTMQKSKPPSIPLLQGHTSRNSGCLESNFVSPSRSTIYKMSSSPYFKNGVPSKDFGTVSSSYRTPSSVHTFGRQVLKRKSIAGNNESLSVGSIRKMHQRYDRRSPLLETRPGCRGYLGCHGSQLDEDPELSGQTQKRRCLDKAGNATLGGLDKSAHVNIFGQAPTQSAEMAAKILKQLDTLVPSQKEDTLETNQKHGNAMDVEDLVSREKEVSAKSNLLKSSPSDAKDHSLLGTFTLATVTEKSVDATSNGSSAMMSKSISQIPLPKDKPPTSSLKRHAPSSLVLSSEIGRNNMPVPSNGFTFPVPAVLGAHSQAPPTPTMASPPILPAEKQQSSIASVETGTRILDSFSKEGSTFLNCGNKLNADDKPTSSNNSGQGASFTCNPVFRFVNSKSTTFRNGLVHTSNSTAFAVPHPNGPPNSASFPCAGSSAISTNPATKPTQSSSNGGSFTFSNTGVGSLSAGSNMFASTTLQPVTTPSLATASQSAWFSVNQNDQSGDSKSLFTKDSVNGLSFKSSEKSNCGSSQSSADSPVGSAPVGTSPLKSSSVFPWAAASGSTSVAPTVPPTAISSGFLTSTASSACATLGSKLNSTALPSFGLPSSCPTSTFSSNPSAVFSFTSATPSIPNPSSSTAISGLVSPTVQMNGGSMIASPFATASLSGNANSSLSGNASTLPSTPTTQFASTTSSSPGIFQFGQQSQASSGGFSMGTGGGNEKSARKFIRVKRKK